MKKRFIIIFGAVFFLTLGFMGLRHSMATQQTASISADTAPYVADEVLVKFKAATPDISIIDGIDAVQGYIVTKHKKAVTSGMWIADKEQNRSFHGDINLFRIHVPPLLGSKKAIEQLKTNSNVEYAEKNYLIQIQTDYYPYQWALNNTGNQGGLPMPI